MTVQPSSPPATATTLYGETTARHAQHTILVADDDDDLRDLTTHALQAAGYRIIAVSDGHAALDAIDAEGPDLVILDISMPGMDGLNVCHHMRRAARSADIPVIMLSSRGASSDVDLGYVRGADHYLIKPVNPEILIQRIQELLKKP